MCYVVDALTPPSEIVGSRAFYFAALLQNAEYLFGKICLSNKRGLCVLIFSYWILCGLTVDCVVTIVSFLLSDMFLKHPNVEDLRILRIYSKSIETKSYYGPHSNKV